MKKELMDKIVVVPGYLHQLVKEIEQEIEHNLVNEDITANNHLLRRLNKKYREMINLMSDYENTLVVQIKNINWVKEEEEENRKRKEATK